MWSSGNMELDDIDQNGVCVISGPLSAAEMDDINKSFFDDLPDIVDVITASSTESARVNDSLHQDDTAILAKCTESTSDCAVTTVPSPPADIVQVMKATMSPSDPNGTSGSVELTGLVLSYGQLPETTQCSSAPDMMRLTQSTELCDKASGVRDISSGKRYPYHSRHLGANGSTLS